MAGRQQADGAQRVDGRSGDRDADDALRWPRLPRGTGVVPRLLVAGSVATASLLSARRVVAILANTWAISAPIDDDRHLAVRGREEVADVDAVELLRIPVGDVGDTAEQHVDRAADERERG